MTDRLEADIVVVGAGSAGCVLAARLIEGGAGRVALIEAGPDSRDPRLAIPLMTGLLLRQKRYNWAFRSEPVADLEGRRIDWPRGKVVGGSGAINGMVYARGLALDYDGWAQRGLTDWSWERVRPYFERAEGRTGDAGAASLALSQPDWWHPLYEAFLEAAETAGLGRTDDLNHPEAVGAGRYAFTIDRGRRASTARRYLDRVRADPNLQIIANAQVLGLDIRDGRCAGVTIDSGGGAETVSASREVVCCAGTVGSPQLLMLSGIGPGEDLAELGLGVTLDRPEVGANLQDHLLVRVEYESRRPGPLAPLLRPDRAALAVARAWLTGKGPAACFPLLAGGYFRSRPDLEAPDLQAHFLPALSSATLRTN
ncbi:MAG: choline dehydrogenase, partial [Alphaproteobacteria bacterium]|nr:choline dehydrogenase [Alphaproteobacteria bacterium]